MNLLPSLHRLLPLGLLAACLLPPSLCAQGLLDTTFANPNLGSVSAFGLGVDGSGKILVVGNFTTAGSASSAYNRLARFNADGTLDTTFPNPNLSSVVFAVAVDSAGKILVGGQFTTAGSGNSSYGRLARFNANGSLDTTFANPNLNALVRAVAVDSAGKILVGGQFTTAGSGNSSYGRLARFNANGTVDTTFVNPNLDGEVRAIAVDASGKIVVAGGFATAGSGNSSRKALARFNADGTLDTTFADPNVSGSSIPLASVVKVDSGGMILLGGAFESAGSGNTPIQRLARFNANGTLDPSFPDQRINGTVNAIALDSAGKILVGGAFMAAGSDRSFTYGRLARFNSLSPVPAITSVTGPSAGGYKAGAVLTFTVNYSGPVTVTGSPQLGVTIGSTLRQATYTSGSGSSTLTFTYTVQPGETDTDGITVASALVGGTITAGGVDAKRDFTAPILTTVKVDSTPPTVLSVVRLNPGAQTLAAGTGAVTFRVTYSEPVQNVIPAGFEILNVNGGTVTGTIGPVTGGPTVYDVKVNITGGSGEFRLRVKD